MDERAVRRAAVQNPLKAAPPGHGPGAGAGVANCAVPPVEQVDLDPPAELVVASSADEGAELAAERGGRDVLALLGSGLRQIGQRSNVNRPI